MLRDWQKSPNLTSWRNSWSRVRLLRRKKAPRTWNYLQKGRALDQLSRAHLNWETTRDLRPPSYRDCENLHPHRRAMRRQPAHRGPSRNQMDAIARRNCPSYPVLPQSRRLGLPH